MSVSAQQQQRHDEDTLNKLELQMENAIETLRHSIIILEDYQLDSQEVLRKRLNETVATFQTIDQLKGATSHLNIPIEVIKYVDDRKNPDLFTKERLATCTERNQQTNGKVEAFEHFRRLLEAEMQRTMPEVAAARPKPS